MKFWQLIISASTFVATIVNAQDMELISKRDAISVFAMSKARWISNVQTSVAAGQAQAVGTAATGLGMATVTPDSYMIVQPDYLAGDGRPSVVHITIAYRDPKVSTVMKGAALNSAIEAARKQLAPEFDLLANSEQVQGRLVIHFFITPRGR